MASSSTTSEANSSDPKQRQEEEEEEEEEEKRPLPKDLNLLPIRICSTVVRGFGRGSSDLGIPTANLDCSDTTKYTIDDGEKTFEELPTGIYWGFCRILGNDGDDGSTHNNNNNNHVYITACSIGYNPTYGNKTKTIEPHLIAPEGDERRRKSSCGESVLGDFYDRPIRLSLVGFLRPELPFEGLDKLIDAIKTDIVNAVRESTNESNTEVTSKERAWVAASS